MRADDVVAAQGSKKLQRQGAAAIVVEVAGCKSASIHIRDLVRGTEIDTYPGRATNERSCEPLILV
jgi:hypothetical protein